MTASGTTNENDRVYFKEWMVAIQHKNRYTTSRDGWLQLEWLNRRKKGLLKKSLVLISIAAVKNYLFHVHPEKMDGCNCPLKQITSHERMDGLS